ncbi:MAG: TetR/AcrR family transcriptional regulator, partial [Baekduiaceae bacterium]
TEVTEAAAPAFRRWNRELADGLHGAGVEEERARRLATTTVAAIESAVVLCRAARSTGPLDDVGAELEASLRSALVAV